MLRSKMNRIFKITTLVFLMFAMFILSACNSIFVNNNESQPTSQVSLKEEVVPEIGGDMFVSMPSGEVSFDPLTTTNEEMLNLLGLIYEKPFTYDSQGRLINSLVESYTVDESKTVFTFTLRNNVYFSDGITMLTADDVLYSLEQVMELTDDTLTQDVEASPDDEGSDEQDDTAVDENNEDENTPIEEQTVVEGPGFEKYNEYVVSAEKIDDLTIKLTTNKAGNVGLHLMTFPVLSESFAAQQLPVGTGPYSVGSYSSETGIVFVRNEFWWQGTPYLDTIVAEPIQTMQEKLEMQDSGLIDLVITDALYAERYSTDGQTQIIDYTTNYYDCIVPNLINSDLKDVNVRQAISYAIDRREILSTVLLNHGIPTNIPIPSDYFAYDATSNTGDHDLTLAREFLYNAGYRTEEEGEGSVLDLTLIVQDDSENSYKREAAKAIQKQLEEVGIVITIESLEEEEYLAKLTTGNYDLAYCSYYMDIVPDLSFMFETDGTANYGYVQSEEINNAIDACSLAITEEEMQTSYAQLQNILIERMPQIGLYFRTNSILCDQSIQGITNSRQGAVFEDIEFWYNIHFARPVSEENPAVPTRTPQPYADPITENESTTTEPTPSTTTVVEGDTITTSGELQ